MTKNELTDLSPEERLDAVLRATIPKLPESVGQWMLREDEVLRALRLPTGTFLGLMGKRFRRTEVVNCLRKVANGAPISLTSVDGELTLADWEMATDGAAILKSGTQRLRFPNVRLLSDHRDQRKLALAAIVRRGELPRDRERMWRSLIDNGALTDDAFLEFEAELDESPEAVLREIQDQINQGGAQFRDFVPTDVSYYEKLIGFEPPPTLAEFKREWLKKAATERRNRLIHLLMLNAPLSILTGLIIPVASARLSGPANARLIKRLQEAGDPLSLIAAFQIGLAHRADKQIAAGIDELVGRVFDPSEPAVQLGGDDFAAACQLTYAIVGRQRIMAAWPAYARRLAIFMHASHIVRILSESNVERPAFHETIARGFGLQARLVHLWEGREASIFQFEFLAAEYVHGIVVSRATDAIVAIPKSRRRKSWNKALEAASAKARQAEAIFYLTPCPFDEFEDGWFGLIIIASQHLQDFRQAVAPTTDPDVGLTQIFRILLALEFDTNDREAFANALPPFLASLNGNQFAQGSEAILNLAMRWRDAALADKILTIIIERYVNSDTVNATSLPRIVLEVAGTTRTRDGWLDRISEVAARIAYVCKPGSDALTLVRAFDIMGEIDPDVGACLTRAKSFALLAFTRFAEPPAANPTTQ